MSRPVIYCRISLETLAQLALFWNSRQLLPKTLSDLVDSSLDAFANMLSYKHPIKKIETLGEALRILQTCGYHIPEQATSAKSIFRALQKESIKYEEDEDANRSGQRTSEAIPEGERGED